MGDKAKLDKKFVASLEVKPSRYVVWDTELPGFGVRVEPSGAKNFILKYRTKARVVRKPTVGRFGSMTCQEARTMAKRWLLEVASGGDPSGDTQDARKGLTVRDAVKRFDTEHIAQKKTNTRYQYRHLVEQEILPAIGSKKIEGVTASDISRMFHRIGAVNPIKANRVRAILSKLFSLAEVWGMRPQNSNPVSVISKYDEVERHRDLNVDETRELFAALDWVIEKAEAELKKKLLWVEEVQDKHRKKNARTDEERVQIAELKANGVRNAVAVIKLLMFTGARRGEILNLRWSEVKKEDRTLMLKDSKTGAKNISLNDTALSILGEVEKVVGVPWVFPSRHRPKEGTVGPMREDELREVWTSVRDKAGLGAKVVDGEEIPAFRIHDLRHNFAAVAASLGKSLIEIGALLGHRQSRTTERYALLVEAARQRAADDVGSSIETMRDTPPKEPAEVTPITR